MSKETRKGSKYGGYGGNYVSSLTEQRAAINRLKKKKARDVDISGFF